MHIDDEALREFCEIWKEEFNEVLSESEARLHASRLLELYSLLAHVEAPETLAGESSGENPGTISR